jgi:hypothetical protein
MHPRDCGIHTHAPNDRGRVDACMQNSQNPLPNPARSNPALSPSPEQAIDRPPQPVTGENVPPGRPSSDLTNNSHQSTPFYSTSANTTPSNLRPATVPTPPSNQVSPPRPLRHPNGMTVRITPTPPRPSRCDLRTITSRHSDHDGPPPELTDSRNKPPISRRTRSSLPLRSDLPHFLPLARPRSRPDEPEPRLRP